MTNGISVGCESGTGKGQADPTVPVGDNKYSGQRTGEVEGKIRVLDPSPPHRREGGREGSVGRDARQPSPRPVGEGTAAEDRWQGLDDSQLFFVDTRETANYWDYWIYPGAISYDRFDGQLLGEPEHPEEGELGPRSTPDPRCFNCGSAEHLLPSCPDPRNRALIDLSRQLFAFFAGDASQNWKRIHEVEEWRSRRLEWTRVYRPGEVTGSLLRDALGSRDTDGAPNMPWLENISLWGYPPGWISHDDPVECVRRRILGEDNSGDGQGPDVSCLFAVLNDTPEDSETLQLGSLFSLAPSDPPSYTQTPRRWAAYPKTYFLSDILPAYNGRALPPLEEDPGLNRCYQFTISSLPPNEVQPPPPPDSPPPLPPPIPHVDSFEDEVDMDLSD